jgi:hypothetical protein
MKEYTIVLRNGQSEEAVYPDKSTLIMERFGGNHKAFKKNVSLLKWSTFNVSYIENVQSGKLDAQISTADVNPFGWRG